MKIYICMIFKQITEKTSSLENGKKSMSGMWKRPKSNLLVFIALWNVENESNVIIINTKVHLPQP